METVIILLGLLLPVLAASSFYVGDHRKSGRSRVSGREDRTDRW